MTREEIEKLPTIIDVLLSESVIVDTKEKLHEKLTEVCNLAIKALEQEPKTGYWIDDKCSVCGKGTEDLISSPEWYRNEEPNFCPFCGVKLESEE